MSIRNGKCIGNNFYGSKISCFCDDGYYLDFSLGNTDQDHFKQSPKRFDSYCNQSGNWSKSFPICSRKL